MEKDDGPGHRRASHGRCAVKPTGGFYVRWMAGTALGALFAAVLGWMGSRAMDRDGHVMGKRPVSQDRPHRERVEHRSNRSHAMSPEEIKRRLMEMYENHPEPLHDWRLRSEAHVLLSELSAKELEDWYLNGLFRQGATDPLQVAILRAWAFKDGPAAVIGGWKRSSESGHFSAQSAFRTWSEQDREKAYKWLESGESELPSGIRQWYLQNSIDDYGRLDFKTAAGYLQHLDPERQQIILLRWAKEGGTNAVLKIRMEEYLEANPEARMSLLRGQVDRMKEDPAVFGFINRLGLPPEDRFSLDVSATLAKASKDPVGAFRGWMERNADQQEVPAEVLGSFHNALVFRQDEVTGWLDEIPTGPLRDEFYAKSIPLLGSRGAFEDAAAYAESISNPAKRGEAIRELGAIWSQKQPEAANAWLQTHAGDL